MSTHNRLALVVLALVACIGGVVYVRHEPVAPQPVVQVPTLATTTAVATTTAPVVPVVAKPANAVLVVDGRTYPVTVVANETLYEAMRALMSSGVLALTGRDYPGLGFFVNSLNGKENSGGMYWVFYVNGVSATEGASTLVMKPGDRIEWKYEKSY
jgi:hypothetical protein